MDIISHGLYGGVAFGRKSKKDYAIAFLFGILPDLVAFGPFFLLAFLGFAPLPFDRIEPPNNNLIPSYVHSIYNMSHSLVIYGLFFALLWVLGKKAFAMLTLGWPLHIIVDMPLHTKNFFPTPFLWPVSDLHIDGIPWSRPYIFLPNVIFIIIVYSIWYYRSKKRKESLKNSNL